MARQRGAHRKIVFMSRGRFSVHIKIKMLVQTEHLPPTESFLIYQNRNTIRWTAELSL